MKGKHYIEAMPDKLRQEWKENRNQDLYEVEEDHYENFRHFLYQTLVWGSTRQGHYYWEDIANDELICGNVDKIAFRIQNIEELGI